MVAGVCVRGLHFIASGHRSLEKANRTGNKNSTEMGLGSNMQIFTPSGLHLPSRSSLEGTTTCQNSVISQTTNDQTHILVESISSSNYYISNQVMPNANVGVWEAMIFKKYQFLLHLVAFSALESFGYQNGDKLKRAVIQQGRRVFLLKSMVPYSDFYKGFSKSRR